ncbi:MAG: hypothetical protein GY765_19385 [bacterium]|nr:hypothetical protein [bacterium]
MGKCSSKKGILSLRDCGEATDHTCTYCNRPICRKHAKETAKGEVCHECYMEKIPGAKEQQKGSGWGGSIFRRRRFYGGSGYSPFYYGHRRRYGHDDYRYFDRHHEERHNAAMPDDDQMDAADFQDS